MTAARTQQQRDAILAQHAAVALAHGDAVQAGRLLGKVVRNEPSFEDVALMFVDQETPDGLQVGVLVLGVWDDMCVWGGVGVCVCVCVCV